jgi:hypothetical protein
MTMALPLYAPPPLIFAPYKVSAVPPSIEPALTMSCPVLLLLPSASSVSPEGADTLPLAAIVKPLALRHQRPADRAGRHRGIRQQQRLPRGARTHGEHRAGPPIESLKVNLGERSCRAGNGTQLDDHVRLQVR